MFNKEIFSSRLMELRKSHRVRQSQLGEAVGISQISICKIEKAERSVSIDVMCAIADYFNVSLDYLVGRSDNPEINE